MAEAGVDIATQRSKNVSELADAAFDYVVTLCGRASETCPAWLGRKAKVIHAGFEDPPTLARDARDEDPRCSPTAASATRFVLSCSPCRRHF